MVILENVTKIYNAGSAQAFEALKSLSLHIQEGEMVVLNGVSGSGKSTLLSLIGALDRPTEGKIVVNEELVSKLPDLHASAYRARTVGMVFQHFNLIETLSVEENVMVPLIPQKLPMSILRQCVIRSMKEASILHKAAQPVRALSGGEKQRCAIARALVHEPVLILCDEPTANLDHQNSLQFIEILKRLHHEGKTVVVATHDPLFLSLPFVDRIIDMEDGCIISDRYVSQGCTDE